MKFDVFCELQQANPGRSNHEPALFAETLVQATKADEAGFSTWWMVEHHGAGEFSISCAPDIMLTAIAQHTSRIHLGHAGVLAPFLINHPFRVAERAATLDILSGGRLEMGLAKSGGIEWETFGVNPDTAREELREALTMLPKMWTQDAFSWKSDLLDMPERRVRPHPLQKPHPRLWQTASSPESFYMAGELGVGVLGTTLLSPVKFMGQMLDQYRAGLKACKQPVGFEPNANKGVFTFVHVAESRQQAIDAGAAWSALWFVDAAPRVFRVPRSVWYNVIRAGLHPESPEMTAALAERDETSLEITPDEVPVIACLKRMALGEQISKEEAHEVLEELDSVVIGDVDHCRQKLTHFKAIGCNHMLCLMQFGGLHHQDILHSIDLTGRYIIPHFAA